MKKHRAFFDFCIENFGVNPNTMYCLNTAWNFYNRLWNDVALMGLNTVAHEFKFTKSGMTDDIAVEGAGEPIDIIFNYLKEYSKFFSDIRKGNPR